jgi:hypothetical protein
MASAWRRRKRSDCRAGTFNTIFAREPVEAAIAQCRTVADQLRARFPKLATLMDGSEACVFAFMGFLKAHTKQIHSIGSSGSTPRSNDAPTSASSRMKRLSRGSSARCFWSRAMSGRCGVA